MPHAADAQLPRHAARSELPRQRAPADRVRRGSAACRGASRSRRTRSPTATATISTGRSACPGSACKRGLADDLVIAPYATALASLVDPGRRGRELRAARRASGSTAASGSTKRSTTTRAAATSTTPPATGAAPGVVRAYFAHHQGMSLVALANVVCDDAFVARFHADPRVQATELLLQERVPREAILSEPRPAESATAPPSLPVFASRRFRSPHTTQPAHAVPVERPLHRRRSRTPAAATACGATWRSRGGARTARPTPARTTSTCAIRGRATCGRHLSAGLPASPTSTTRRSISTRSRSAAATATSRRSSRSPCRPRTTSRSGGCRSPTAATQPREIEVTSYAEIVLARPEDDLAHPAFGKLFIETEFDAQSAGLLFSRRPRGADESPIVGLPRARRRRPRLGGAVEWETDRARFLGRGRSPANPMALDGRALSGTTGAVLDPIGALRERVRLAAGRRRARRRSPPASPPTATPRSRWRASIATAAPRRAPSRWRSRTCTSRCSTSGSPTSTRCCSIAWRRACSAPTRRASARPISPRNTLGQPNLWGYGISGDLPIVLVRVTDADVAAAGAPAAARAGVLARQGAARRRRDPQRASRRVPRRDAEPPDDARAGTAVGRLARTSRAACSCCAPTACPRPIAACSPRSPASSCRGDLGDLASQLDRPAPWLYRRARRAAVGRRCRAPAPAATPVPVPPLVMENGLGGFTPDGREYVVVLDGERETPLPWSNVLANPDVRHDRQQRPGPRSPGPATAARTG